MDNYSVYPLATLTEGNLGSVPLIRSLLSADLADGNFSRLAMVAAKLGAGVESGKLNNNVAVTAKSLRNTARKYAAQAAEAVSKNASAILADDDASDDDKSAAQTALDNAGMFLAACKMNEAMGSRGAKRADSWGGFDADAVRAYYEDYAARGAIPSAGVDPFAGKAFAEDIANEVIGEYNLGTVNPDTGAREPFAVRATGVKRGKPTSVWATDHDAAQARVDADAAIRHRTEAFAASLLLADVEGLDNTDAYSIADALSGSDADDADSDSD